LDSDPEEDPEDFLASLGFKDPFHKNLYGTLDDHDHPPISQSRKAYPSTHFMTSSKLSQIDSLLQHKPHFSTILGNLLFSANNPFQDNFPFMHDTSQKKSFAKR
jgi:hypothetical protein